MKELGNLQVDRVLLATDFSRWTTNAVEFAFDLARRFDAEVLMVHGIEPINDAAVDEEEDDGGFEEFFGELVERSRRELEELVARAQDFEVAARFHIEIGQRWRIIVEQAEREDVDLIVMGRRAYRRQSEVTLGTTSQRVFFSSPRPVLTVPSEVDEPLEEDDEANEDPS